MWPPPRSLAAEGPAGEGAVWTACADRAAVPGRRPFGAVLWRTGRGRPLACASRHITAPHQSVGAAVEGRRTFHRVMSALHHECCLPLTACETWETTGGAPERDTTDGHAGPGETADADGVHRAPTVRCRVMEGGGVACPLLSPVSRHHRAHHRHGAHRALYPRCAKSRRFWTRVPRWPR